MIKIERISRALGVQALAPRFILFWKGGNKAVSKEIPAKAGRFVDAIALIGFFFFVLSAALIALYAFRHM